MVSVSVAVIEVMRVSHCAADTGTIVSPDSQRCTDRTSRPATSRAHREIERPEAVMWSRSWSGVIGCRCVESRRDCRDIVPVV